MSELHPTIGRQPAPSPAILVDRLYILIRTHLWAQILVAMVLGIGTGLVLSPTGLALLAEPSARVVAGWLALPGQVFLALIQMIMIPLVMRSIILGISSSGDPTQLRRLGSRIGPYFLAATLLAVGLGATLVSWLQPGTYLDASVVEGVSRSAAAVPLPEPTADESLSDLIVRLIPRHRSTRSWMSGCSRLLCWPFSWESHSCPLRASAPSSSSSLQRRSKSSR